jgi:antitoxin VapB
METARVFGSGRSQAVRLPKESRVEGCEVRIKRRGNAIVLEPIPDTWGWLDDLPQPLDEDFVEAAREQLPTPERPGLDKLFR